MISFDDADIYASEFALTANDPNNAFKYLQGTVKASETVALNALGNTSVFQDDGESDTLVQLTGVTASNLNNTGLVADGVWLV